MLIPLNRLKIAKTKVFRLKSNLEKIYQLNLLETNKTITVVQTVAACRKMVGGDKNPV